MTTTTRTSGASRPTATRSPSPSTDFVLTLWTSDPQLARAADVAGVDRIGVDLEHLGKLERQRDRGTWLSTHSEDDLAAVGAALERAGLFARVNPLNPDSAREIDAVLAHRARVLMLPMVIEPATAKEFVRLVAGRAWVVLLVEHIEAIRGLDELVSVEGVDEVHIGLNDLALSLGLPNRWLVLADDELVLTPGRIVREAGLRFGFGGLGAVGDFDLPVPTDLVYAEYARIEATGALLSRSFFRAGTDIGTEVFRARNALANWRKQPAADLAAAHAELVRHAELAASW